MAFTCFMLKKVHPIRILQGLYVLLVVLLVVGELGYVVVLVG